jgi:ParB/RepB/Spo0J family partition protein
MAEYRIVPMSEIDEPETPMRFAMDDGKLRELCDSIVKNGLLQPIGIKPKGARWEIEYGHRRYVAYTILGRLTIAAMCFSEGECNEGAAMLAENIEREDITAAEEAVLFAQAEERYHLDEAGMVARFRKSADYIGDRMRLLRGDPRVFDANRERKITFTAARELNKCEADDFRFMFLTSAITSGSSGREIARWVADWRKNTMPADPNAQVVGVAAVDPVPVADGMVCCICGGGKDKWNLVNVFIHKRELETIVETIARPPE